MSSPTPIFQLRIALLAAVIAVLVWVFAEGESITTRSVMATVHFPTKPTGDVLLVPNDANFRGSVSVRLEGTTRTIDAAASVVGNKFEITPGQPGVPSTPGKGRYVDLREAINSIPELRRVGSTVAGVEPPVVGVEIIRLVKRDLPVHVEMGSPVVLDGEPTVAPGTVSIRIPESMASRIPEGAVAVATVSEQDLQKLRAEEPQSVNATIRLPDETVGIEPLIVETEQVIVTLRLRRTVDTLEIATVPVWFSLPPNEDRGQWVVELRDRFITKVVLSGPTEQLEKVRSGQWPVKAMIELSSEDLAKGVLSKQAIFPGLPPGVTASAGNQTVQLARISKRDPDR